MLLVGPCLQPRHSFAPPALTPCPPAPITIEKITGATRSRRTQKHPKTRQNTKSRPRHRTPRPLLPTPSTTGQVFPDQLAKTRRGRTQDWRLGLSRPTRRRPASVLRRGARGARGARGRGAVRRKFGFGAEQGVVSFWPLRRSQPAGSRSLGGARRSPAPAQQAAAAPHRSTHRRCARATAPGTSGDVTSTEIPLQP